LIVLSGEYYFGMAHFDKFKDPTYALWRRCFDDLLKNQWDERIMNTWKSGEVWADNTVTDKITIPGKNKVYFWCGPNNAPVDYERSDRKYIYTYTDAKTQTRLNLLKRASFFRRDVQDWSGIRNLYGFPLPDSDKVDAILGNTNANKKYIKHADEYWLDVEVNNALKDSTHD
jgi:hypothetical protein